MADGGHRRRCSRRTRPSTSPGSWSTPRSSSTPATPRARAGAATWSPCEPALTRRPAPGRAPGTCSGAAPATRLLLKAADSDDIVTLDSSGPSTCGTSSRRPAPSTASPSGSAPATASPAHGVAAELAPVLDDLERKRLVVARTVTAAARPAPVDRRPRPARRADRVADRAARPARVVDAAAPRPPPQRLSGLLVEALSDGALPARDEQAERGVAGCTSRRCAACSCSSPRHCASSTRSRAAGVEAKVLKGSAVAHLDYPDPAQRTFGDVDLLVRSRDIDAAVRVLAAEGHARRSVEPRPGFDRRFGKGATFTHRRPARRSTCTGPSSMGPYGLRMRLDDLWERPSDLRAGRPRRRARSTRSAASCTPATTLRSATRCRGWSRCETWRRCCCSADLDMDRVAPAHAGVAGRAGRRASRAR